MTIQQKQERVDALLERTENDPETVERVWDALDRVSRDRAYLDAEDGFQRHLLHHISEYADTEKSSCGCNAPNCPLPAGRLPDALQDTTDSLPTEIDRWASRHGGTPHVLLDAVESWGERRARVERTLSECASALVQDDPSVISLPTEVEDVDTADTAGGVA